MRCATALAAFDRSLIARPGTIRHEHLKTAGAATLQRPLNDVNAMGFGLGAIGLMTTILQPGVGRDGPRLMTPPNVSPDTAEAGVTLTLIPGEYAPRGGGTVSLSHSWRVAGKEVGTGLSYTPSEALIGKTLRLRETATEIGGTKDGSIVRTGYTSVIRASGGWSVALNPDQSITIAASPPPPPAPNGTINGQTITFT